MHHIEPDGPPVIVWPDNRAWVALAFDLTWDPRPQAADSHRVMADHGESPHLALHIRRWKERTVENPEALVVAMALPEGGGTVRVELPAPGRYELRLVATDGSFSPHTISVRAERSGVSHRQTTREQVRKALERADPLLTRVLTFALDEVDLEGIDTVADRHASRRLYYRKYLDLPRGLARQVTPLTRAGLLDHPPGAQVLDLGSGAGHCLLVCRALGHHAVGIDIPDEIFDDLAAVLQLERVIAWIRPDEPLPVGGQRFDLIHSLNAEFFILPNDLMQHTGVAEEAWRAEHWHAFAGHLRNALAPGGQAYIFLNDRPADRGLVPSSPDFAPTLTSMGFDVTGRLIRLQAAP